MPRKLFGCLLIFAAASGAAAWAEATPPSRLELTIASSVKAAEDANPTIQQQRERVQEAEAGVSYAFSQLFPQITLTGIANYQKNSVNFPNALFGGEAYNFYSAQAKLTQPLYQAGALTGGISAVKKEVEIRKLDLEVSERDLTFSVLQAFYTALLNEKILAELRKSDEVQRDSLKTAERWRRVGRNQLIDVLQIKTTLALLQPRIAQADNQRKTAGMQLATLLHRASAEEIQLTGSLVPVDRRKIDELASKQASQLPELTRSQQQISQFEDQRDVTTSVNWPSLSFIGTYGRSAYAKAELLNDFSTAWALGFQLTIPIFSGLSSFHQRDVLNSQQSQLEFAQSQLVDTLSFNQVQTQKNLDTATSVLNSSREAAELAQASLKEARRDYALQTINSLQFLTSQQSSLDAETSYLNARYSYIIASAQYFIAKGIPLSTLVDLLEANSRSGD